jgi:hypothetical protein
MIHETKSNYKTTVATRMFRRIWRKIKKFDFYPKALLITIPCSIALLAYLIGIDAADLIFSNWFVTLVSIPTFFANSLSSAAYFGRTSDLFASFKRTFEKNKLELLGTLLGMALGLTVGIGLALLHVTVPLSSSLYGFAAALFSLRYMNIFAGLGNRLGRCADKKSRPLSEKIIILAAGLVGLTLGLTLFAFGTAGMISIVGITSFFSGGAAIPAWIAGFVFVMSVASLSASCADYCAKGISFIRARSNKPDAAITAIVKERRNEYAGSLLGIAIGLTIGAIVIGALILASNPIILSSLIVGIVASSLVIASTTNVFGSIFSR